MGRSLIICGRYTRYSGYHRHARELIRALGKLGISVKLVELPRGNNRDSWFDTLDLPVRSSVILLFFRTVQRV